MLGLKLPLRLLVVVDETETLRDTTTELGLETEDGDTLLVGLVESGELLTELGTRDVGAGGVEDSEDELLPVQEAVGDELRSAKSNGAVGVLGLDRAFELQFCKEQGHSIRRWCLGLLYAGALCCPLDGRWLDLPHRNSQ